MVMTSPPRSERSVGQQAEFVQSRAILVKKARALRKVIDEYPVVVEEPERLIQCLDDILRLQLRRDSHDPYKKSREELLWLNAPARKEID